MLAWGVRVPVVTARPQVIENVEQRILSLVSRSIWTAAKHYRDRGFHSMNVGASEGLSGVRRFKEKFGAAAVSYRRAVYVLPRLAGMLRRNHGVQ
jgi:hypothetical protein